MPQVALTSPQNPGTETGFETVLQRTSIALFTCDGDLRYLEAWGALPGFPARSVVGRYDEDVFAPEDAARLTAFKRGVLATGRNETADLQLSLGGRTLLVEARGDPLIADGQVVGLTLALIDTPARRQAERAGSADTDRTRLMARAGRDALLLHDGDRILDVNRAYERMFCVERHDALGREPFGFITPEAREAARARLVQDGRMEEWIGLRADGSTLPIEVSVEAIAQHGQNLYLVQIEDLTRRKLVEAAYRESEERYRALAAATREGVIIHDGVQLVEVNQAFCALHGTTREGAVGSSVFRFIAPESREEMRRITRSGTTAPFEAVARREDGSTFPIEAAGQPIVYQGRLMRVATVRDLTARRAAEGALRESEERFRGFAEASADVLWVVDAATGRLEYLSPAYEAIWARSRNELMQDLAHWMDFVHSDDRPGVASAMGRTLSGERVESEYRILRPDGTLRWIRDAGFPIRGADGKIRRAAGIARDITLQKEDEGRRRLLLDELNHRVKNTLATVQSIARQTLRHASSPAVFQERFEDRLLALSQTHNLLTQANWERASLSALLKQELTPYGKGRSQIEGDQDVHLSPRAVVGLGMALHELTTNAAKYGALSSPGGRVCVRWQVLSPEPRLHLEWRETGGPPITAPPSRQGFGSRLLERGITAELGGSVQVNFAPEGLVATIDIPLDRANAP